MADTGLTRRRGRRSSFERSELIAVALELGPDNLDVRSVAGALAVPRTTVYNHVGSPEELGRLVLLALLDTPPERANESLDNGPWQAQLEAFAVRLRDQMLSVGPWLRYYDPDIHVVGAAVRDADRLIGRLVDAGFTVETAGHALTLVNVVVNEAVGAHGRNITRGPDESTFLTRLSEDDYPWIAAARVVDEPAREEDQFRFNLRCALAGIAVVADELLKPVDNS